MRFSIIIPGYNEENFLPRLLDSIAVARSNFSGGADQIEVIVADNSSTDSTAEVAAAHGARVVTITKRCIAAARNGGARAGGGEILCFIDADSAVHPETFNAIDQAMKSGRYIWGVTGAVRSYGHLLCGDADGVADGTGHRLVILSSRRF